MQEPLVSILIPAFNAEKTIALAVESCLRQTYPNLEIIILDDGSTDRTIKEIQRLGNVKLILHDSNAGIPAGRNALLRHALGEYIAWLDADDTMLPERIEKQVSFMQQHPEVDIAGSWILTDNPGLPEKKLPTENALITAHLWFKNCVAQPSVISRNFYVNEHIFYHTNFYFMQDYELWFRLRHKKVFANIPEYLTRYHFSSMLETHEKHLVYNEKQKADDLWHIKWKENDFGLSHHEKKVLQKFLHRADGILASEVGELKAAFNTLQRHEVFGASKENKLMLNFYRLLLFRKMMISDKLRNLDLLISFAKYREMKRRHLIQ